MTGLCHTCPYRKALALNAGTEYLPPLRPVPVMQHSDCLTSAAADMLAALRALMDHDGVVAAGLDCALRREVERFEADACRARAAIRKATGQPR
ncbi:hypothetical protein DLJ53_21970 [Acuticoccus sediminis]|uniref:Uncharacterized protein n=1 Tax=Acuticoccus sediminis TaxID=2184697 RepID=A0A8B2NIK5_9HYPH|nr:hypothetical protein [Acuticoccus sediminis]RAH99215.1 hypothetical protein DLJ53_21970 [Acuticoccus sediminis]